MGDTLRSIADGMEHRTVSGCSIPQWGELVARGLTHFDHDENCCPKCRLEALLAEYEKVDLVKKWKQAANDMREGATRERAYAERFYDERAEHLRNATDFDDTANLYDVCAAELETWLAVNLERIKAQARLETEPIFKWLLGENGEFVPRPEGAGAYWWRTELRQRIAALEAQAKEKP